MNPDYPYLVLYLVLLVCAMHYWKYEDKLSVQIAMGMTFLFFAFRAPVVGADTWNYVRYLAGTRDYYNELDDRLLEPLFVLYRMVIKSVSPSYGVIMVINTVVTLSPLYFIFKKYASNVPLAILMFINLNSLVLYFVGLRQIIALVPLLLALVYCIEKKPTRFRTALIFFGASVVSAGFHTTGLIYGLIYCLALIVPIQKRAVYLVLVSVSAVLGLLAEKFNNLDVFSSISSLNLAVLQRIDGYLIGDNQNELSAISIALRPTFVGLVAFSFIKKEMLDHPFSKIFLAGIVLYNFLATIPLVHRMVLPMVMFGGIVFTWCFSKDLVLSVRKKKILHILALFIILYFCRSWFIRCSYWSRSDDLQMHPYCVVFEKYR